MFEVVLVLDKQSDTLPRAIRPRNVVFHSDPRVLPEGSILCNDEVSLPARSPRRLYLPSLFQDRYLLWIFSIVLPVQDGSWRFLLEHELGSFWISSRFFQDLSGRLFPLHTTISISGPTIFCHLALIAARIWGVSSLDGSLNKASTLAASSSSSETLSRSPPSCKTALSTVVCDSPSGSISVVVSPSCNRIIKRATCE